MTRAIMRRTTIATVDAIIAVSRNRYRRSDVNEARAIKGIWVVYADGPVGTVAHKGAVRTAAAHVVVRGDSRSCLAISVRRAGSENSRSGGRDPVGDRWLCVPERWNGLR